MYACRYTYVNVVCIYVPIHLYMYLCMYLCLPMCEYMFMCMTKKENLFL